MGFENKKIILFIFWNGSETGEGWGGGVEGGGEGRGYIPTLQDGMSSPSSATEVAINLKVY